MDIFIAQRIDRYQTAGWSLKPSQCAIVVLILFSEFNHIVVYCIDSLSLNIYIYMIIGKYFLNPNTSC